jgi:hypothetical protein
MVLRHVGVFVNNIELIDSILLKLGFSQIYNEVEIINYRYDTVRKYLNNGDGSILEVIEDSSQARSNSFHLCFDNEIPEFMRQYYIEKYIPKDNSLSVDFVYINDSIYFEFVRNKNEL